MGMDNIESREDYERIVKKYADRLKVARGKFDDFRRAIDEVEAALAKPAPKEATEEQAKDYASLVASGQRRLKDVERVVASYEDHFDTWKRTVKLYR